ncbi:MAG TPA: hypothetical protein VL728_08190 [Cyclobacteriaceae bacterium]|jgi:hypothetical protein|nr:hypothetical protein [Cyclobacteriaceae bacterium]
MKRVSLVLAGVVLSTLVWAKGIDKPTGSSVAVIKVEGSSLFKLLYKSDKAQSVKVSLLDEKGNSIFHETLKNKNGFVRPYNFSAVEEGHYTLQVQDENGTTVEKIDYVSAAQSEKLVSVTKASEANKYILRIASPVKEAVTIRVYDRNSTLLHSETLSVGKEFAQVYNMKDLDAFTIEVTDKNGLVKAINY